MNADLVLTTINAPHRRQLSAPELADCLLDHAAAKAASGHVGKRAKHAAKAIKKIAKTSGTKEKK